ARPPSSSSHRARRGRPNASWTSTPRHEPSHASASTSSVPSPPSATGSSTTSTPGTRRAPRPSAAAASTAVRTPLRLAGHASTRIAGSRLLLHGLRLGHLDLRRVRHHLEHRVREPLAREEQKPEADADRGLDRLEADPVRDPAG